MLTQLLQEAQERLSSPSYLQNQLSLRDEIWVRRATYVARSNIRTWDNITYNINVVFDVYLKPSSLLFPWPCDFVQTQLLMLFPLSDPNEVLSAWMKVEVPRNRIGNGNMHPNSHFSDEEYQENMNLVMDLQYRGHFATALKNPICNLLQSRNFLRNHQPFKDRVLHGSCRPGYKEKRRYQAWLEEGLMVLDCLGTYILVLLSYL